VTDDPDAFPQLNDAELAALGQLGVRRRVSAGEYLYREGDAGYDFYVILAGAVGSSSAPRAASASSFATRLAGSWVS
jgi:CRP-like cAMP-binding protein